MAGATPEAKEKLEVMVEVRDVTEPTKTLKGFKEGMGSVVKKVRSVQTIAPLEDGMLGVQFKTREQQGEVTRLQRQQMTEIESGPASEPVNMIYDWNDDLQASFGPAFLDDVNNITFDTTPVAQIFRRLVLGGEVFYLADDLPAMRREPSRQYMQPRARLSKLTDVGRSCLDRRRRMGTILRITKIKARHFKLSEDRVILTWRYSEGS